MPQLPLNRHPLTGIKHLTTCRTVFTRNYSEVHLPPPTQPGAPESHWTPSAAPLAVRHVDTAVGTDLITGYSLCPDSELARTSCSTHEHFLPSGLGFSTRILIKCFNCDLTFISFYFLYFGVRCVSLD